MRIVTALALIPTALFASPVHMQSLRSQGSGAISQFSRAAPPALGASR